MQKLLFLPLLLLGACKKDDPQASLPPATQTGANTGGCLINGEPFVATGWGGDLLSNPIPALGGGFFEDSLYYLRINGKMKGSNATVTLFFHSQKIGKYLFNRNTQYYPAAVRVLDHATYSISDTKNEVYVTNVQHTGQVNLNYVSVAQGISAGTFEFTAASQLDPSKTITITQGRFDRKQ